MEQVIPQPLQKGIFRTGGLSFVKSGPLSLLLGFAILQLIISLLTDGFALSFDEAMWHYIGRNWFRYGMVPYSGGVDNKSPLIFVIYGISDRLFGVNYWFPRILGTLVQTGSLWLVYLIGLRISGRRVAILSLTLCGLSFLWRSTDGKFVSLTETYAIFFLLGAFYFYFRQRGSLSYILAGLLAGLAIGFRLSALFGTLSIFIVAFRHGWRPAFLFLLGVSCAVLGLLALAGICHISLHDLFLYGFLDNFGTGSATDQSPLWKLENFTNAFFYSELLLFYPSLLGYLFMRKKVPELTLWLILECIGIIAVGIFARAHFKLLLPVFSLTAAIAIHEMVQQYNIPFKPVYLAIWLLFFPKLVEPIVNLKKIFIPPSDNAEAFCADPNKAPGDQEKKALGIWIRNHTREDDLVLVAGYGAIVQAYSERRSPSIFFNATQTGRAASQFAVEINAYPSRMVLVPQSGNYKQEVRQEVREAVDQLVASGYHATGCRYGYKVYEPVKP
jgi:hypothetical protein